jgi:glutathione S-transferase
MNAFALAEGSPHETIRLESDAEPLPPPGFFAAMGELVKREEVDIANHPRRSAAFSQINRLRQAPALMVDGGTILIEPIAFEDLHVCPPLFGQTPVAPAFVEMRQRRPERHLFQPVDLAFRHSHRAIGELEVPQFPTQAEVSRSRALEFLSFRESALAERECEAGPEFSVADNIGLIAINFRRLARIPLPDGLTQVRRWHAALASRPSAGA